MTDGSGWTVWVPWYHSSSNPYWAVMAYGDAYLLSRRSPTDNVWNLLLLEFLQAHQTRSHFRASTVGVHTLATPENEIKHFNKVRTLTRFTTTWSTCSKIFKHINYASSISWPKKPTLSVNWWSDHQSVTATIRKHPDVDRLSPSQDNRLPLEQYFPILVIVLYFAWFVSARIERSISNEIKYT